MKHWSKAFTDIYEQLARRYNQRMFETLVKAETLQLVMSAAKIAAFMIATIVRPKAQGRLLDMYLSDAYNLTP